MINLESLSEKASKCETERLLFFYYRRDTS